MNQNIISKVIDKMNNNNFHGALIELNNITSKYKTLDSQYLLRGDIYLKLQDYENALIQFQISHRKKYMPAESILGIGLVKEGQGKYREAYKAYKESLNIKGTVKAWIQLGILYEHGFGLKKDEEKAMDCYEKSGEIPNTKKTLHARNKGQLLSKQGKYYEAIKAFLIPFMIEKDAFRLNPEDANYATFMPRILQTLDNIAMDGKPLTAPLVHILEQALLIKSDDKYKKITSRINKKLYRSAIAAAIFTKVGEIISMGIIPESINLDAIKIKNESDIKIINLDQCKPDDVLREERIIKCFNNPILYLGLKYFRVGTFLGEEFFTSLRKLFLKEALLNFEKFNEENKYSRILEAIAYQCFENEYVWDIKDEEKIDLKKLYKKVLIEIKNTQSISRNSIFLLSSYKKLIDYSDLKLFLKENISTNNLQSFIKLQITDFEEEQNYKKSIQSINEIKNNISLNVQSQYEEYPYPRWGGEEMDSFEMPNYMSRIQQDIFPNHLPKKKDISSILIAGCGTGYQAIAAAKTDKNAIIYAMDISKTSLSYGMRQAKEYGINNIEWIHGDILSIKNIDKNFDLIESTGVLHHMEDPQLAFNILTEKLNKDGYFKLALYAKKYRELLIPEKSLIKELKLKPNTEDVRKARQEIKKRALNKLTPRCFNLHDFYSTSEFIDLLMHQQELSFSMSELKNLFIDNYTFLGFVMSNLNIKANYSKKFPNDKKMINLNNWDKFEEEKPELFRAMYQLWLQKK